MALKRAHGTRNNLNYFFFGAAFAAGFFEAAFLATGFFGFADGLADLDFSAFFLGVAFFTAAGLLFAAAFFFGFDGVAFFATFAFGLAVFGFSSGLAILNLPVTPTPFSPTRRIDFFSIPDAKAFLIKTLILTGSAL